MSKPDKVIQMLRILQDMGCDVGDSSLSNYGDPAYMALQTTIAHVKFGYFSHLSNTTERPVSGGSLRRWLASSPSPLKVLHISEVMQAYVEAGPILLMLDLAGSDPAKDEWGVTLHGTPGVLLAAGDWFESLPKKRRSREKPTINLVADSDEGLRLKEVEVPRKMKAEDLDLYYGDGFTTFHETVLGRLRKDTAGILILHGPPGGGKTSYVRLLTSCLADKKRVIVVPRSMVEKISSPSFTNFMLSLRESPSVLVVEDAEDIITADARASGSEGTSTLLNLTDGLLNDATKAQAILTFNCPIAKVDPALLRSGRLIGMREFGPLSAAQARRLAEKHGKDASRISGPTMLCDVLAEAVVGAPVPSRPVLGFGSKGVA